MASTRKEEEEKDKVEDEKKSGERGGIAREIKKIKMKGRKREREGNKIRKENEKRGKQKKEEKEGKQKKKR